MSPPRVYDDMELTTRTRISTGLKIMGTTVFSWNLCRHKSSWASKRTEV